MLAWLSRRVVKDAWYVVGTWAVLAVVLLTVCLGGVGGAGLFGRLETGDSSVPRAQSARGEQVLRTLSGDSQTVSLLVTGIDISDTGTQQEVASALTGAHADLRALVGEQNVLDPFVVPGMLSEPAAQALASADLDGFLMIVTVNPNGSKVAPAGDRAYAAEVASLVSKVESRLKEIPDELRAVSPAATGVVSDDALVSRAVDDRVEKDLVRGGLICLPLVLLVMTLVLDGPLAAVAPLLGGLAQVAGSLGALYALDLVNGLSPFVVATASALGLALSLGYGLIVTRRYREELAREGEEDSAAPGPRRRRRTGRRDPLVADCMTTALTTAGRTALFSGLTVAASLAGLTLMGADVLWSVGVAGTLAALVAVAAALTLVPALLVLMGRRLQRPSLLRRAMGRSPFPRPEIASGRTGGPAWIARQVRRMPWVAAVAGIALLIVLASPLHDLRMLTSTTELLPAHSDQRTYLQLLQDDYPAATQAEEDATLIVASTGERVTSYINEQVAATNGVTQVLRSATAGSYTVVYLDLEGEASSVTAEKAVAAIRSLQAPADTWVTGQAATQLDFRQAVVHGAPWAASVLVPASVVFLFLMSGSVIAPLRALLVNAVCLAACLGITVWVFQDGRLSGLLGFTPIGGVEAGAVVAAAGAGLALTMSIDVFVLARIKECRDAGDDDDAAVERGLQRSGPAVSEAALVMAVVFLCLVTSDLLMVKEVGLALATAVVLEATVTRMLLVPATMSLLGRWSWWAPRRLRRMDDGPSWSPTTNDSWGGASARVPRAT